MGGVRGRLAFELRFSDTSSCYIDISVPVLVYLACFANYCYFIFTRVLSYYCSKVFSKRFFVKYRRYQFDKVAVDARLELLAN